MIDVFIVLLVVFLGGPSVAAALASLYDRRRP